MGSRARALSSSARRPVRGAAAGAVPEVLAVNACQATFEGAGRIHVDLAIAARPRAIIASARRPERLRWLHETFGARAADALLARTLEDPDASVRKRAAEALIRVDGAAD